MFCLFEALNYVLSISRVARNLGFLGHSNSNMFNMGAIISMTTTPKLVKKKQQQQKVN